jgi:hypothetical protein
VKELKGRRLDKVSGQDRSRFAATQKNRAREAFSIKRIDATFKVFGQ